MRPQDYCYRRRENAVELCLCGGGHPREMGAHRKEKLASTTEERESGQEGELSPLLSLVGFVVS